MIKRALRDINAEVFEAKDGLEALTFLTSSETQKQSRRINTIISDVRMPRMTGPHFLYEIRKLGFTLPFIFFSSNLMNPENEGEQLRDENVYYLTKDSGLETLKQVVASTKSSKKVA